MTQLLTDFLSTKNAFLSCYTDGTIILHFKIDYGIFCSVKLIKNNSDLHLIFSKDCFSTERVISYNRDINNFIIKSPAIALNLSRNLNAKALHGTLDSMYVYDTVRELDSRTLSVKISPFI